MRTGEERLLFGNAWCREIVFNPVDKSLMGIRHENGLATLVRIPQPYDTWNRVYEFPYGVVPYHLGTSADGRLLSGSVERSTATNFCACGSSRRFSGAMRNLLSEFRFGQSVPESFTFSPDGRYLYGSSYYTGVSNIFRFDVATGAIEAVSNAETGCRCRWPMGDWSC